MTTEQIKNRKLNYLELKHQLPLDDVVTMRLTLRESILMANCLIDDHNQNMNKPSGLHLLKDKILVMLVEIISKELTTK